MKTSINRFAVLTLVLIMVMVTTIGCTKNDKGEIVIAAAASLQKVIENEIVPMYNKEYPNVKVTGTFDSSGKLQKQIEEGAKVDIFFSAATKQMDILKEKSLVDNDSVKNILKNEIVLIGASSSSYEYIKNFEDIVKGETIALGDPKSVPAGEYAKESLENLGLWSQVERKKISYGTNVTEVLNWVAEGSANLGIVYKSDAVFLKDKVKILSVSPEGSHKECVYPAGLVSGSENKKISKTFVEFLLSDEAQKIFEKYGFQSIK